MGCVSGEDAPINELVDFITAAQIAQELEKDTDDTTHDDEDRNEVVNDYCTNSYPLDDNF